MRICKAGALSAIIAAQPRFEHETQGYIVKSEPGRSGAKPRNTLPPPAGAVTLEMVAKEAGVSASTVSRILNGTAQVRDSKARAVNAAIAKLRFMPNPVAQSLARGRSMSVGVITQAISSPFYAEALAAIETQLLRANYSPLFMSGHWVEADERRCIDHLLSRRVGGIILLTSCLPDAELIALSRRTPLLLMGRRVAANQIVSLDDDDTASARLATDFLISLGHRRIAFIAGTETRPDARQRFTGYKAALAAHKIPFQAKLVANGNYSDAGGYAAMNALLDSGEEFSAAFAANDQSAYGALLDDLAAGPGWDRAVSDAAAPSRRAPLLPGPAPALLHAAFERQAEATPLRPAVIAPVFPFASNKQWTSPMSPSPLFVLRKFAPSLVVCRRAFLRGSY